MIAKAFLVGPLVIACFSHGVSAQENRSFAPLEFVLSNDHLSQQTIWPFRLHDDLIDAQHPMWDVYERALASHPTTARRGVPRVDGATSA